MNRPLAWLLGLLLTACSPTGEQVRERSPWNDDWKFALSDSVQDYSSPDSDDSTWRILSLPHDWSIEGDFSLDNPSTPGGGALPGGIGWYRKTFTLPETDRGKVVYVDFDGVYRNSEVWINGHSLGFRPNGYVSFRYDLTPYLRYGSQPNVIVVNHHLELTRKEFRVSEVINHMPAFHIIAGIAICTPHCTSDDDIHVLNLVFDTNTHDFCHSSRFFLIRSRHSSNWIISSSEKPL